MSFSSSPIKNIAVVGASGNVGSHIVSALLAKSRFTITAITRTSSNATFAKGVTVARVDYDDPDTLVQALKGQHALIITMSTSAQSAQGKLIRAAATAAVPWILPNEFGMFNTDEIQSEIIGPGKRNDRKLIESLGVTSWIGVTCGFWYEHSLSGGLYGIDVAKKEVTFFDDGMKRLNTSTWPQVGRAVANLLALPLSASDGDGTTLEEYRNKMVFVSSFALNQREMLEALQKVTGATEADWKISFEPAEQQFRDAMGKKKDGDRNAFGRALYTRYFIEEAGLFEKSHGLDNEKLGLPKESLEEATRAAIKLQEGGYWSKK